MINTEYFDTKLGRVAMVTLTNSKGARVTLSSFGAGIVSLVVSDKDGVMADVVLGYGKAEDYFFDGPAAGKVPGRFANRIAGGRMSIDGVEYALPVNNGPNCLHGGGVGFHNCNWQVVATTDNSVTFRRVSGDGEMGFPGTLAAKAHYEWTDDNRLELTLEAETDAPTVVNLTNHAYWNLGGHDCGSALGQTLWLNADRYLPTDDTLIPTGELAAVAGTPMDFTSPKTLGRDISQDFDALRYGKGYDACWAINGWTEGRMQKVAVLKDARSGRVLEVSSDQPGVQVYTGNWLYGCPRSKSGTVYHDYDAVAIECQGFPDAPNKPHFPSALLRPGEKYLRHITFALSVE